MIAPRLTVVGHCTSTTARILCCTDGSGGRVARLAWRADGKQGFVEIQLAPAPPYELGVLDLVGLPAGAEVTYAIAIGANARELPAAEAILQSGGRRCRLLAPHRAPRIALLMRDWSASPCAREAHPREDPLIPLMVVAGAAAALSLPYSAPRW